MHVNHVPSSLVEEGHTEKVAHNSQLNVNWWICKMDVRSYIFRNLTCSNQPCHRILRMQHLAHRSDKHMLTFLRSICFTLLPGGMQVLDRTILIQRGYGTVKGVFQYYGSVSAGETSHWSQSEPWLRRLKHEPQFGHCLCSEEDDGILVFIIVY